MNKEELLYKYNIFTGIFLNEYINENLNNIKYRRKIIKDILSKFNTKDIEKRLISITGDRRRGKTTSILQVIQELLNRGISSEDIILINGNYNSNLFDLSKNLLYLRYSKVYNPKYIFIDEITDMSNLNLGLKSLSDELKYFGNNIVITGTWSQIFYELKSGILLDRVLLYELEQITFNDNKKYLDRDTTQSINNGLYIQNINIDITFQDCIDNMNEFLKRSIYYSDYKNYIKDIDIKLYYFSLLYMGKQLKNSNIKDYSILKDKYSFFSGNEDISMVRMNKEKVLKLIEILMTTKQIVMRRNFALEDLKKSKIDKYEIIPKNISIRSFLNKNNREVEKDKIVQTIFEDYLAAKFVEEDVCIKLRYNENEEIDIIDRNREMLIEVKHTDNVNNRSIKHLLNRELLKTYKLETFSKNIVYLGETKILNNGINLWNIYDFEKEILKEEHLLELNPYYKENQELIDIDRIETQSKWQGGINLDWK